MKKFKFCLMAVVMLLTTTCEEEKIHVTGVEMLESEILLMIPGVKKYFIKAMVTPENASKRLVRWDSDNKSVATIDRHSGELTVKGLGNANITATTVDGGLKATCKVKVTENRLKNPGFEEPDDTKDPDNLAKISEWERVPQEWFTKYYTNAGTNFNLNNVNRLRGSNDNALFFREANAVDGKYVVRVNQHTTGGIYQIVSVEPGNTYRYKANVGFKRITTDTVNHIPISNQSIKDETLKFLSPDGMTLYDEAPINVDKNIKAGQGTVAFVTGEFTAPEGVTEVRFQFDQRTFTTPNNIRAPLMLIDNCQFIEL